MKQISLILFFAVSLAELLAEVFNADNLHLVSKPLIMITLGLYYGFTSTHRSAVVYTAILFSLAGDILLMFELNNQIFFMAGLAAFLIAHIFYILAYRQHQYSADDDALKGIQKMRFAFPIVLWGTGLIVVLYPSLGDLKIPVVIYAFVLIVMVLNAIFRYGRTSNDSFWFVFGGSVLFLVSDSLLAINKFSQPISSAHLWVMSTYMLAQFMIINGLCKHMNKDN